MKVDVQFHLYLSVKLTLWTRDRAEEKRARQFRWHVQNTRFSSSKLSCMLQTRSVSVSVSVSVVRIDEENEGNEENHLTHHLLGPAPWCPVSSYKPEENEGLGKLLRIPRFSSMKADVPHPRFFSIKLALWTRDRAEVKRARQFRWHVQNTRFSWSKLSCMLQTLSVSVSVSVSVQLLESMRRTRGMKRVILHTMC